MCKLTSLRALVCAIGVLLLAMLLCCGCSRKVYIPVETVRVSADSVATASRESVTSASRDYFFVRDSVVIDRAADTVRLEVYRWRERTVTDTVAVIRADTVRVESVRTLTQEVPVEVPCDKRHISLGLTLGILLLAFAVIGGVIYVAFIYVTKSSD